MRTSVDISYYPLKDEFLNPIRNFIDRMNNYKNLIVETNGMSTQIFGEYEEVMNALSSEIKKSFELPHSVFIIKIVNADLQKND
ncbi:MAG: hypothetical protein ISR55_00805 [Bacteroidetes bacterium]|nr:hypothetical protein [Bacteroidota bacterium]